MLNKVYSTGKCYHNGTEISAAEYDSLMTEYKAKAKYVNDLFDGRITIEDVPAAWREEVLHRVNERIAAEQEEPELTADEALDIILGGEV